MSNIPNRISLERPYEFKKLYCIRHGLALHNALYHKYGSKTFYNPDYVDTPLLPEGQIQAYNLNKSWNKINEVELVIVSPLKRTLETAVRVFYGINIPIIALDICREYPLGLHTCNKRSNKEELQLLYPRVNFDDLLSNKDDLWNANEEETLESLETRITFFKEYIKSRPETIIAFVNHSSFIGQMKDHSIKYLDNGDEELKHCHPYEYYI